MSTKPARAKRNLERHCMELAIAQARQCVSEPGKVSPKVGAVVLKDGVVLGVAFRGELDPGDHAEFTLLERKLASSALAGATLFTTLEPCTSRNSPKIPCVERVIERRLAKVFIGVLDPNDQVRGRGEHRLRQAGIEVSRFDADLMAAIEELNRDFSREHPLEPSLQRSAAETHDPVEPGQTGPNGFPIGYTPDGDKVEWIKSDAVPDGVWGLLLRRNDNAIIAEYNELWNRVWYVRHKQFMEQVARGEAKVGPDQVAIMEEAEKKASEIEKLYGRESLVLSDFEWGLLSGRMSALAWVMGAYWEESLDT